MAGLDVGQKIKYFELPDQQDYPWSLSGQLEMGPVMLVFYRGDWSPYCNGQLASIAREFEEFESSGCRSGEILESSASADPIATIVSHATIPGKKHFFRTFQDY